MWKLIRCSSDYIGSTPMEYSDQQGIAISFCTLMLSVSPSFNRPVMVVDRSLSSFETSCIIL